MMETKLGKIESIRFGHGGYQDAMLGIHFTLSGSAWGVCDSKCAWDAEQIKWTESCEWTENTRHKWYSDIMYYISELLAQAKVNSIDKLMGKPVEATFDGNVLKSWRILTEVL